MGPFFGLRCAPRRNLAWFAILNPSDLSWFGKWRPGIQIAGGVVSPRKSGRVLLPVFVALIHLQVGAPGPTMVAWAVGVHYTVSGPSVAGPCGPSPGRECHPLHANGSPRRSIVSDSDGFGCSSVSGFSVSYAAFETGANPAAGFWRASRW